MSKLALTCFMLLLVLRAGAQGLQKVEGSVIDTGGRLLPGVTIQLCKAGTDTLSGYSDAEGKYSISQVGAGQRTLLASYHGLVIFDTTILIPVQQAVSLQLPPVVIRFLPKALEEVVVRPPPVTVLEDTLQYNAGAFQMRDGASVEELIRKFPGLTVDRDGNITAQGKRIVKVRVDGKDFFAGDVRTATQNLPADIVRNIQIIDDYGEQAALTGIKAEEPQKIININTKRGKSNGAFGNLLAGAGTEGRYQASLSLNQFRTGQQISFVASANNINSNSGALSGTGKGSGSTLSGAPGIARSYNAAINYRDKWGKKITVYGSYAFSRNETEVESQSFQQDLNPGDIRKTDRSSVAESGMTSHQANWTMEYAPDTKNLVKLIGSGVFSGNESISDARSSISRTRFFTSSRGLSDVAGRSSNINLNLIYNRRFQKPGRNLNLSLMLGQGHSADRNMVNNLLRDVDSAGTDSSYTAPLISLNKQRQRQDTRSSRSKPALSLSYIEPLWGTTVAEVAYALSYEKVSRGRDVFDQDSGSGNEVLNPGLTNDYLSTFLYSRYSLNIQSRHKRYNYLVGIVMQPSQLDGVSRTQNQETHVSNLTWAPAGRFVYRFNGTQSLTLNYNGNYQEPDFQKLQPLVDSTNPSNIIVGNPNLKPEFSNRVTVSYNASNRTTGGALFANISYEKTLNRIVNSVFNDPKSTSRTTTYLNDNGFYSLAGNVSASQPLWSRRLAVSAGLNGNFSNTIAYTDLQRSTGQSWMLLPNLKLLADFPDLLDAELSAGYAINRTDAVYNHERIRTEVRTFTLGLNGRFFIRDLCIGYSYDKQLNSGFGGATNISPDILSLYVEYRLARNKAFTIRLQGLDLLNQNERLTRSVSGTTIIDNRYNGLRRYLMLTAGWRLSRFGG